jgi:hypothetical protein
MGVSPPWPKGGAAEDDGAVVVTVNVEVASFVPGVTALGENEQDDRFGSPEHASETASSKEPPRGLMVTV